MSIYDDLLKQAGDLRDVAPTSGVDAFLDPESVTPSVLEPNRIRIASLRDLVGFSRIGQDTLVHKAEKDLWKISEDNGEIVIERLFDPTTKEPLRI